VPKIECIVTRSSADEKTFAIVRCRKTGCIPSDVEAELGVKRAVTEWVKTYDSGKRAWAASSHDFNVGDLVHYLQDPDLQVCLAHARILDLEIEICTDGGNSAHLWFFDDVLVREDELDDG
jgi:hypothetical protein